ncbi:MAG TPA: tRNA (adenosine(37)-N6)-threonylcarbamoyltransferase complex ATPase subunit type 1 TsaE [Candidatus Binataceae bacterium]|nr:tRNA (adenosine(37)-N6)-threonylcarbamoyltransferase complex ATPase subunit type 1 TsaE [Candidatus Binataceae bacterium]
MYAVTLHSSSARETKAWGRRLASLLSGGELLGFSGELGAGKTCFIKGLARGLHLREERILSPTFTMIQEHHGRLPLYHIDLYRLDETDIDELGLREYLFSTGVAAVEWFERLREAPALNCLQIRISYDGANYRKIELLASDDRYGLILERLQRQFG